MDEYNGLAKGEQISIFHLLYKQEHEKWKRIPEGALIKQTSDFRKCTDDNRIDYEANGFINNAPAIIGFVDCISGPGEIYKERLPKYYK